MGGKSPKATSTTNQTSTSNAQVNPYAGAQPGLDALLAGAANAYGATDKRGYQGALYAAPNQTQLGAAQGALDASGRLNTGASDLRNLGVQTLQGAFLDPSKNQYLQSAIGASINPLAEAFKQHAMSIGDQAQLSGAYGGGRQGVLEGTALRGFNQDAMNLAANMNYQNYSDERGRQIGAGALLNQANALDLQPSQVQAAVGDQQQQWSQNQLAADLQKYQMGNDAPWAGLDRYQQILSSFVPYASSNGTETSQGTTTSTQKKASGGLTGALSGAAAGSAFGPWGAAIGGIAGLFG